MNDEELKKMAIEKMSCQTDKYYLHIDWPLSAEKRSRLLKRWQDPRTVAKHRWLPFIQYNMRKQKYNGVSVHTKFRKITVPSHTDRWLFKFYSELLMFKYESYLKVHRLGDVSVAYREGKSSLLCAKQAIDFAWGRSSCWIIKGDFSNFFDNLRHKQLRQNLLRVLTGSSSGKLSDDWYNVITGLEKYHFVSRKKINKFRSDRNQRSYFQSFHDYNQAVKKHELHVSSKNRIGIPQGTAISGVLANVYMIDFDRFAKDLANKYHGIYRRYSDDFILVIPCACAAYCDINDIKKELVNYAGRLRLTIEDHKSKIYRFEDQMVYKDDTCQPTSLVYLGIVFTGRKVSLQNKDLYRLLYRGKRQLVRLAIYTNALKAFKAGKGPEWLQSLNVRYQSLANTALQQIEKQEINNVPHRRQVTTQYLSNFPLYRQNFLDYAEKAQRFFEKNNSSKDELYTVAILKETRRTLAHEGRYFNRLKKAVKCYN